MNTLIHIAAQQSNNLLAYITDEQFWEDTRHRDLSKNRDTFEFSTFSEETYSYFLRKRNQVIIPNKRGPGYAEFIIRKVSKSLDSKGTHTLRVLSHASYLELKKQAIIYPQTLSEQTPSTAVGVALDGTGWAPGRVEGDGYRTFHIEEHTNPYWLLKRIASEFKLELRFRIEVKNGKVVGRYVDLLERVGAWRGYEANFGHNLANIERIEKSAGVVTALLGVSPPDTEGNIKTVMVTDEEALKREGIYDEHGNLQHLYDVYYPESTRQDMTEDELQTYTENELEKRVNSRIEYKAKIETLAEKAEVSSNELHFGDTIRIKDEKFNPPLYVEARIHVMKESIKQNGFVDVTLGDFVEYTEQEVFSIWRSLQKQIAAKIEEAELRSYTYNKLTIDTKDTTVFEEGKTFAALQANTAETNAKEHADTVASQAQAAAESYADTQADNALASAKAYAVAQTLYDAKMQEIAGDLSAKADLTYVDGQLVSKANKADVYTISEVDNALLNKVSVTTYETDMNGVVQDLNTHSTLIAQNQDAIAFKADASRVNTLEGTVSDHSATLSVHADEISTKVETTTFNALEGRVDSAESTLIQHANEIDLRVKENGVIAAINLSPETILLDAARIEFTGHVFGEGATFKGTLQGGRIETVGEGFNGNPTKITIDQGEIESVTNFSAADARVIRLNKYGLSFFNTWDTRGTYLDDSGLYLGAESTESGFQGGSAIYNSFTADGYGNLISHLGLSADNVELDGNIYVRTLNFNTASGAVFDEYGNIGAPPTTVDGAYWGIVDHTGNVIFKAHWGADSLNEGVQVIDREFKLYNSSFHLNGAGRVHNSGDGITYIQGNDEIRATKYLSGTLAPVRASDHWTGSLEEYKTGIVEWKESALDLINSATIYEYRLVGDATGHLNQGLVIGEGYNTPAKIINANGETISQYAMNSWSWKGLQELSALYHDHDERINYLEMENELLKAEINKLKGVA